MKTNHVIGRTDLLLKSQHPISLITPGFIKSLKSPLGLLFPSSPALSMRHSLLLVYVAFLCVEKLYIWRVHVYHFLRTSKSLDFPILLVYRMRFGVDEGGGVGRDGNRFSSIYG